MPTDADRLSLDELAALTDMPPRTIRFYIQQALLDRPEGAKRGAYYTRAHLERLLAIRRWRDAGLSLDRIRELLSGEPEPLPERRRRPGDLSVRSHLLLAPGIELVVDPEAAGLDPEDLRVLARRAAALLDDLKREDS